jgi:hypothetical protein
VIVLAALAAAAAIAAVVLWIWPREHAVERPIDRGHQTEFGERSHWLQPWRAYLDTRPAAAMRDAVGINFNVEPGEADAAAKRIAAAGFTQARVEIGWGDLAYDNPGSFRDSGGLVRLRALRRAGIRPLILLNSWHGAPTPRRVWEARLTEPAASGATAVMLDSRSAREVRPGRSGLDASDGSKAAEVLFTDVAPDGTATLSRALPAPLDAGAQPASTLLYPPFAPPQLSGGRANPAFGTTLRGWLDYVRVVTRRARSIVGPEFDVEIWNELSFGSDFLYRDRYYDDPPAGEGDPTEAVLEATVSALRDPATGVPDKVGIATGFTSQSPFESGATVPPGTTALGKHPYKERVNFPEGAVHDANRPLDARGRPEGERDGDHWRDSFVPTYDAYLPEYWLTAIQTEHLIRDLSPFTTRVYGETAHGRTTHPRGSPPPRMWVTEIGLDPAQSGVDMTPEQVERLKAKTALRALVAFVGKGADRVHLFAAGGEQWQLLHLDEPGGGESLTAIGRLTDAFAGPDSGVRRRPLTLERISDRHDHEQFGGDGSEAHPPLFDRDVVAVLPFQASSTRYVIPAYVMTRDMADPHRDDPGDVARFDLPAADFKLTIGGLADGARPRVTATDPLTGTDVKASITGWSGGRLEVELPLTDYPRLLTVDLR